jgi:two-component system, NtrC family, sensor histidine kinase PilS
MLHVLLPQFVRSLWLRTYSSDAPNEWWRSLFFFNVYRLILAIAFALVVNVWGNASWLNVYNLGLFAKACMVYAAIAAISLLANRYRWPNFNLQLAFQVFTDIACVTALSHASGGIQGDMGMLLLVSLASAGLISRGRITLFFAALASIAMLLEHSYSILTRDATLSQFMQVGMLSAAYFAVAWLTHSLSKYAIASERLAEIRGVDLSNLEEANRLVIQDMPDGVLLVDKHGAVRQANPGAARLLAHRFSAEQDRLATGSPVLGDLFDAWRQQDAAHPPAPVLLSHLPHPIRVRFLPVQRDNFGGAVIVLEDMQRVQAEAQQVKLAALGRLTMNIAHEVRNPLASIRYATELLREAEHDPTHTRLLQIIADNTTRLNRIVQDVMELNRRDRVQIEAFDLVTRLPALIDELCQTHGIAAEIFTLSLPEPCPIRFDGGHFEQVLWNLCLNALRYSQQQANSVQLQAQCGLDGRVSLDIGDDGAGIAADLVQKLFEPFFTTNASGTGLGLYIARELCEANAARLDYRPVAGRGACFRITFGETHEPE